MHSGRVHVFSDKFFQLLTKSEASEKLTVKETTPVILNGILLVLLFQSHRLQKQTYLLPAGVRKSSTRKSSFLD